jgi:hypothetical protein
MRPMTAVAAVAGCHLLSTIAVQALVFAVSMSRFDSGQPAGALERGGEHILAILSFPLLAVLSERSRGEQSNLWGSAAGEYIPFAVNSLLWAVAIVAGLAAYRRYRPR